MWVSWLGSKSKRAQRPQFHTNWFMTAGASRLLRSSQRPSKKKKSFVSTRGLLRIFLPRGPGRRSLLCCLCAERDAPITRFEKTGGKDHQISFVDSVTSLHSNPTADSFFIWPQLCVVSGCCCRHAIDSYLSRSVLLAKKNHVTHHKTRAARNET